MKGHFATDLTGNIYGNILVEGRAPNYYSESDIDKKHPRSMWKCKCLLCGTRKVMRGTHLTSGAIISCGCVGKQHLRESKIKHGKSKTKLYQVWRDIKTRCLNPKVECYERYGGRGITICKEWENNFQAFYEWCTNNGYNENAEFMQCQIDRIDNNGPYAPWNCRFVTAKVNANNRRKAKLRDQTIYTVLSISATRYEWQSIIHTNEYRIKMRAKEWEIPIEMFILYVIERNAKIIKTKAGKTFDKDIFTQSLISNSEKYGLSRMNETELRSFISSCLDEKRLKKRGDENEQVDNAS